MQIKAGTGGAKGFTYLSKLQDSFNDITSIYGKQFAKISKEQGLPAARKWKNQIMAEEAAAAGINFGEFTKQLSGAPGSSAASPGWGTLNIQ